MKLHIKLDDDWVTFEGKIQSDDGQVVEFVEGSATLLGKVCNQDNVIEVVRFDRSAQTVDLFAWGFGGLDTVPAKEIVERSA